MALHAQPAGRRPSSVGRRPGAASVDGRERLLESALNLFAERGIANTTVAQIAAAGHVTSAMVHYWFDTREKLLDAIVDERLEPLVRQIWAAADTQALDATQLVRALLMRWLEITAATPWMPSLWLREIVQEGGLLRERVLARIPRDRNAAFRRTIAQAQARGEIGADISPDLLFVSMMALVMVPQATAKIWRRINPDVTVDRAALERHVLALMMHGLAGSSPATGSRARGGKK